MKECKQFKDLFKAISRYSDDARKPFKCFATGKILGFTWRLFQERIDGEYCAWLGINDETSTGSKWPAFYNKKEIEEWVNNHK